MRISVMIEGQIGLTWVRWRDWVALASAGGWAGLYRSDHFTNARPPDQASLEMIVSLAYAADHSQHITFGPLVAPFSFRDPVMLARQAAHLDDLSGGRMILGVGAGWQVREHEMYGYPLLDRGARMERFAEGLEVVTRLLHDDEPVTFNGRWYTLQEARIAPRLYPTRVLVGGNGMTKTIPLAARFANSWNGVQLSPADFQERAEHLERCVYDAGRPRDAVTKTTSTFLVWGADEQGLNRRLENLRSLFGNEHTADSLGRHLREQRNAVVGYGDTVLPQLRAYADAGVEELMLQIFDPGDVEGVREFGATVIPQV